VSTAKDMTSHPHRRQVLLFLVALIIPSAALVGLGLRMLAQERELAQSRLTDEQRRVVTLIRQDILGRLERTKLEELGALATEPARGENRSYLNPEVELVATIVEGRLVLPWELRDEAQAAQAHLSSPDFARAIQQAERAEFQRDDHRTAVAFYSQALEAAQHPVQVGYARLSLSRALANAGRERESHTECRRVLALPSSVTDQQGFPLAYFAAARLLDGRLEQEVVLERFGPEIESPTWRMPAEAHMLQGLLDTLAATATDSTTRDHARTQSAEVHRQIELAELALSLQRDFQRLGLSYPASSEGSQDPKWVVFGEGAWLVGFGLFPGSASEAVVAVNADSVLGRPGDSDTWQGGQVGAVGWEASSEGTGILLGASLPGLEVTFPDATDGNGGLGVRYSFYIVAALLLLTTAFFGAYLLWRDMRRELRLADLRSQFVSSVSHELKTPLTSIRMFAELLQMKDPEGPGVESGYLGTIVGESERLTRLLNNVLDHSKIEQDRKIYRQKPTSLPEVAGRAARALQYPLEQDGFTLSVDAEDGLPPVSVDPDALEQAILNLLTNAMKYSGESRDIDMGLLCEDDHVIIEVTDQGVGVEPEEVARLTEKFYRGSNPENRQVPGTGLGLALVEHMAKAHGGELRIRSVVGKGSTFSIRLPLGGEE
jgi:signal transduction histidine kinase